MNPTPSASDIVTWTPVFGHLLSSSPFLIVCLVGVALSIARWERHPRISLFVVSACAIDVLVTLVAAIMSALPLWFLGRGGTNAGLGAIMALGGITLTVFRAVAVALLLTAAFWKRSVGPQDDSSA